MLNEEGYIFNLSEIPQKLLDYGIKKQYFKDEIIIAQGDVVEGLYIITKGRVVGYTYYKNGEKKIYGILEPIAIFGMGLAINSYGSPCNFECSSQVELLIIEKNVIIDLIKNDFDLTLFLIKSEHMVNYNLLTQLEKSYIYKSENNICDIIVNFAKHYGIEEGNNIKINFNLSLKLISELVGVNILTVIRTFNKLKGLKIIEKKNEYYYISDFEQLMSLTTLKDNY